MRTSRSPRTPSTSREVARSTSAGIFAGIVVIIISSRLIVTHLPSTVSVLTAVIALAVALVAFAAYNQAGGSVTRSVLSAAGWALMFHVCDVFWTYGVMWALVGALVLALGINFAGIYREQRRNGELPAPRR